MNTVGKIGQWTVVKMNDCETTMLAAILGTDRDPENAELVGRVGDNVVMKLSEAAFTLLEATLSDERPADNPASPEPRVRKVTHRTIRLPAMVGNVLGPPINKNNVAIASVNDVALPMTKEVENTGNMISLIEAANRYGLPDWHFRRAVINKKIPAWKLGKGVLIRDRDAEDLCSRMRDTGWAPVGHWDPKYPGSYNVNWAP